MTISRKSNKTQKGVQRVMIGMLVLTRWFGAFSLSTNTGLCCFLGTLDPMFAVSDSWLELDCKLLQGRCRRSVESGQDPWNLRNCFHPALGGEGLPAATAVPSGLALPLPLPHPSSLLKCSHPINQTDVALMSNTCHASVYTAPESMGKKKKKQPNSYKVQ